MGLAFSSLQVSFWSEPSHRKPKPVSIFHSVMEANTTVVKREIHGELKNHLRNPFYFKMLTNSVFQIYLKTYHISQSFVEEMRLINEYSLIGNPNPPQEEKPDSCPS